MTYIIGVTIIVLIGATLINKKQRETIKTLKESLANSEHSLNYTKQHIENITRRNREAMVGARVMVKSNENDPIAMGTLLRFEGISQANNPMPIVKYDGNEREYLCFAAVLPYNEKILNEVKDLSPKKQWEKLKDVALYWE